MILFIPVAGEAHIPLSHGPGVGSMAGGTITPGVGAFFMQAPDLAMTGPAFCLRLDLLLFQMAGFAF